MTFALADLRCACGSPNVVRVDPGDPPEISESSDILTKRGRPIVATCLACWPMAPGVQQDPFGAHA